jgi:predicted O-methyltransferase YrrM
VVVIKIIADLCATGFGLVMSPVLHFVARRRVSLPRFQRMADRMGFQIRSTHYYEPTYTEADLPADTTGERQLPGLEMNGAAQLRLIEQFVYAQELRSFPLDKPSISEFGYRNNMYSFGDAEILYSMIRHMKPKRIIEIGAGNSTLMAQLAIRANRKDDPGYVCRHICVEPYEARWLETVDVELIRKRVEDVDLSLFGMLEANDVLFIDSSHVIRPFGDVLREFQVIIPLIAPGVLIQIDDIFTPRDYPDHWLRAERHLWNEQYLLESFLAFNDSFEVICASNWLKHNHQKAFLEACPMMVHDPSQEPGAFWIRRVK